MRKQILLFIGLCIYGGISANETIENEQRLTPQASENKGFFQTLSVQLFNTYGYTDMEASFWSTVGAKKRHSLNLRLGYERFNSQHFGIGLGYGYELRLNKHLLQPYLTYNHNVETWNNAAVVNGLYYTYQGRFDFAVGTTTNFDANGYTNNSNWIDAYYNIKAYGGMQVGFEYCIISDSKDVYYGIIFQKSLWRR